MNPIRYVSEGQGKNSILQGNNSIKAEPYCSIMLINFSFLGGILLPVVVHPVTRGFDRYYGLKDGACNFFNPGLQRPGEGNPARKRPSAADRALAGIGDSARDVQRSPGTFYRYYGDVC